MSKSVRYLIGGLIAVAVVVAAVYLITPSGPTAESILAAFHGLAEYGRLTVQYPLDGTLFPPDICAPTFRWKDDNGRCDTWLVSIEFEGGAERINTLARQSDWTPDPALWETIKKQSVQKQAKATIIGVNGKSPKEILSASRISIKTSADPVGAPIFYRAAARCARGNARLRELPLVFTQRRYPCDGRRLRQQQRLIRYHKSRRADDFHGQ